MTPPSPLPVSTTSSDASPAKRLPYLPGLDGLRALAVVAVVLYHAGLKPARGGFLGVDVFFVISGYIITCLLIREREASGHTRLAAFWGGRARRLLPAVYTLLVVLLLYSVAFLPEQIDRLREASAAAFAYVTNWYLLFDKQSYFETFERPLLLRHLWSLAVEEQFYLIWPLLFLLLSRLGNRKRVLLILVLAAASSLLMLALAENGASADRLYYGTDTRAAGFLIGCALAFAWRPFAGETAPGTRAAVATTLLSVSGLAGLLACVLLLPDDSALLYRGGFALVSLLTAAVIAGVVRPGAWLARLVGLGPLSALGRRSYSVYLWHWPVVALTRPHLDTDLHGAGLLAVRVLLTLSLAEISYRWVETPFRNGSVARLLRRGWQSIGLRRPAFALGGFFATVATVTAVVIVIVNARASTQPYGSLSSVRIVSPFFDARAAGQPATVTSTPTAEPGAGEPEPQAAGGETAEANPPDAPNETPAPEQAPAPPPPPPADPPPPPPAAPPPLPPPNVNLVSIPPGVHVTAIGDSVMLGAAYVLAAYVPGIDVDAMVGRQASSIPLLLWNERQAGRLAPIVVIHTGDNGKITEAQFREIMAQLPDREKVIFVNDRVPRDWQDGNNLVLAEGVKAYANARLVDWYAASKDRPDFFWDEGVHVNTLGASVYVSLITQAIASQ